MMDIAELAPTHVISIIGRDGGNGWNRHERHWLDVIGQVEAGLRTTLVAELRGVAVGYGSLLWRSSYPGFAANGIPEIHDLATDVAHRGTGIATGLIGALEQLARQRGHTTIGLGVGLYADYGAAQRLYVRLGYGPDGKGVTYRQQPVVPGAPLPVDDDLLLWLTKQL
jgi:GNAT superfamily N-acetyltransferase